MTDDQVSRGRCPLFCSPNTNWQIRKKARTIRLRLPEFLRHRQHNHSTSNFSPYTTTAAATTTSAMQQQHQEQQQQRTQQQHRQQQPDKQRRGLQPAAVNAPRHHDAITMWEQELAHMERVHWPSRRASVLDDPLAADSRVSPPSPDCRDCAGHDITFDSAMPLVTGRSMERMQRMARMMTSSPQTTARQPAREAEQRAAASAMRAKLSVMTDRQAMASPAVSPSSTPEFGYKKRARTPLEPDDAPLAKGPRSPTRATQAETLA